MFLDVKPFSETERPARERQFSNWSKVAEAIYNTESELFILQILQLELRGMRRRYVIERLYSRFSGLRARKERRELKYFFEDLDPLWGDKKVIKAALKNWHTMQLYLNAEPHTREHVRCLMYKEYKGKRRSYMLKRLHGRYNTLRMQEEKKLLWRWKPKSK